MEKAGNEGRRAVASARVLVVEDEPIVALDLERTFTEAGATVIGPAYSVAEAMELARGASVDVAILDVRLGEETSRDVVDMLTSRGVPMLIYSGQVEDMVDVASGEAIRLSKPASRRALIGAVGTLLKHSH
jgi:DNA-binding NtrC family response regulator